MTQPDRPPETYRQWLDCLQYLTEHPTSGAVLALAAAGKLSAPPSEQFIARISDTVSVMLTACFRTFLRKLDELLAEGDPDEAVVLARRFRRQVESCLLYRSLDFLPRKEAELLEQGFSDQIRSFWMDFQRQLRISARESMNPVMDELSYELGRMKILTQWRTP